MPSILLNMGPLPVNISASLSIVIVTAAALPGVVSYYEAPDSIKLAIRRLDMIMDMIMDVLPKRSLFFLLLLNLMLGMEPSSTYSYRSRYL
ncbi:KLTH0F15334p [Lachancea thermotolerans CBS 6340]|uniref:KLTH0F15334p n=1 Tax=Lachancea thermotolerans (strain ATCC 56472 / CBS 6340 / NRRL Y-8284) TaxID=559295 RepID=C5DJC5_LACTC|nr:KLTH0F15334p [Lachancea thermotolerans CBS 6340]CAR24414.1 KLTH0F15334p [Lachancea thermotolerans CBS 6340]